MTRHRSTLLRRIICLVVGGFFLIAGITKATDPGLFLEDIRSFQILPDPWAAWLALGLPWLEITAAMAVISGIWRPGGLLTITAMLVIFISGALHAMSRGLDIRCGCFGGDATTHYAELLTRNAVLLALTLCALAGRPAGKK